jgi:hypothetical protein
MKYLLSLLLCVGCIGDVAFTSLSGNRVPLTYAWPIIDTGGLVTSQSTIGAQFTPVVGGTLDTVLVAVKRNATFSKALAVPRVWTIEADAGGKPSGIVLDRLAGVPPTSIINLVLKSNAKPYLKAGSKYWLLCIKTADGNYDNWATSELLQAKPEFAKWPVVYQQQAGWLNNKAAIPAFAVNVVKCAAPPVVTPEPVPVTPPPAVVVPPPAPPKPPAPPVVVAPPVVTPPATPPVVTPPATPPVVTPPPAPATVEIPVATFNEILKTLEDVIEKLKKPKALCVTRT